MPSPGTTLRFVTSVLGLIALWVGCDLISGPLRSGGPMNLAYNPSGVPLVALGVAGITLAAKGRCVLLWPLAVLVTLATAGVNFYYYPPVEDGAFHALRAGVPDPDAWPAPAFLYAFAFAPIGVAAAALCAGSVRAVALLLPSAAAAFGAALAFEAFARALLHSATGSLVLTVAASVAVAVAAAPVRPPVGAAVAGQAALLSALCLGLWLAYAAPL